MFSLKLGPFEVYAERRKGTPWLYFERYSTPAARPGLEYRNVELGLPGVHVEAALLRPCRPPRSWA